MCQEIKIDYNLPHFPTSWQAVIFRNYGLISSEKIGKILNTDKNTIEVEAKRMGYPEMKSDNKWIKSGYISLIRNNWHLLTYEQLCVLLGISLSELQFMLKEDDFLDVKLGFFKPAVNAPEYSPLSEEEIEKTEKIAELLKDNFVFSEVKPFDFFSPSYGRYKSINKENKHIRFVYSYSAIYGDFLLNGNFEGFKDEILKRYQDVGINGIWIHALLSELSYYPFNCEFSKGYHIRRKNLNILIEKCKKYGIKLYLYLNEPRSLPSDYFDKNNIKDIKGHSVDGYSALCSSHNKTKEYLYEAIKSFADTVPDLGGIMTITMSENLTNCVCKGQTNCKICCKRKPYEITAEINNIMHKGLKDSLCNGVFIANLWGWAAYMGWNESDIKNGIDLLNKDIIVMNVSETEMNICKGGIENTIIDYSLSNIGPSKASFKRLSYARERGHKVMAKIQVNNSWEMSAVPFIPVFHIIFEHIINLKKAGINDLMMSWTLGGYPSVSFDLVNYILQEENPLLEDWCLKVYGNNSDKVIKSSRAFSDAFQEFPFDVNTLYYAPQNMGPGCVWNMNKTNLKATMVGYPYDDIDTWRGNYPIKVYINQLYKLCKKWKDGLYLLDNIDNNSNRMNEFKTMAEICYIHFRSSYLYCQFIEKRDEYHKSKDKNLKKQIFDIIDEERENTIKTIKISSCDARIGYEPSNHYFYSKNTLLEKLVNLEYIKDRLDDN